MTPRMTLMTSRFASSSRVTGPLLEASRAVSIPGDIFTYEDVKTYSGAPIFLEIQVGDTTYRRPATLGGLLDVGGSIYGLMVAHAASKDYLHDLGSSGKPMSYVHYDDKYEIPEDREDLDLKQPLSDAATGSDTASTRGRLHDVQEWLSSSRMVWPRLNPSFDVSRDGTGHSPRRLGSIRHISSNFDRDLFDWAIVELDTSSFAARQVNRLIYSATGWLEIPISSKLALQPGPRSAIVAATGSSGYVKGYLFSTPVLFQMEPGRSPLQAREVVFEKELKLGFWDVAMRVIGRLMSFDMFMAIAGIFLTAT
ncbi:hypothetical protein TSTA_043620 [Talaromyces stipitatus ATCC 10500]|uniref:Uncharacterized protein n=1 Tax=Talaromyces stipitatus (strain ATCC 10500 / CBS 375.48 / QM 6759 / NRRL 1006) TaxID=441959 RepID=B8MKP2_TALSN|nr:uncharacterized protein TSTA_043620 [Talaromyces stipitatus ATCC 10500]EED14891.1 hypothetical protein TSTA_043620 [Talaromyces stipitatus ATCC 10500]